MVKNLNNMKWESVALEGFPIDSKFEGFVGLEECTDYGLDSGLKSKKGKKTKPAKNKEKITKRKQESKHEIPSKKVKLSNGFTVEDCSKIKPSITCEVQFNQETKVQTNKKQATKKAKLGENVAISSLTLKDMASWEQFQIPEEILRALAEQGFQRPTRIQEMALPAAMLGRRDILGAAETGSGKTLAFGIPILSGIMKLKENQAAGQDIYSVPYKKTSVKKSKVIEEKKSNKIKKNFVKKKVVKKDSSEEGYESDEVKSDEGNDDHESQSDDSSKSDSYLEEYDVPIRKKSNSADEGHESESDDDYLHISDVLDDDMDASDDEVRNDEKVESDEEFESDEEVESDEEAESDEEVENDMQEGEIDNGDETDVDDKTGISCVKVIDDIEIPQPRMRRTGKPLYALILTPTRELAIQISRHLIAAAKYTGIKIATIVGGMAAVKQERVLNSSPEIVVATPGRLWELLRQGQSHLEQIDSIKFLAIDETDRMIERNHFEELHPLLERLNSDETRKNSRQNFVFSATLTLVHDLPAHMRGKKVTKNGKIINRKVKKMTSQQKVKKLVDLVGMTDPKVVDITAQNLGTSENLTECRIACTLEQKDYYLFYILKRHPGRTLIFCNSIGSVKRLAQLFGLLQCRPLPLHASMPQRQRLKNLERFRDDAAGVLIATDVAARGLDIPNVDHVVHYQVPRTAENYVHRSGRTARANKEGLTIILMEPGEAATYSKLCRTLNKEKEHPIFPVPGHVLDAMRSTVNCARDLDRLELTHRRTAQEQGWLDKAAKDMDIIVDDELLPKHQDSKSLKQLSQKRKQLEAMLAKPFFPKGFSFKYPSINQEVNRFASINQEDIGKSALEVMKSHIESGRVKKVKRVGKNAPLLKLEKMFKK